MSAYYQHYANIFGGRTKVSFDETDEEFVITEVRKFKVAGESLDGKKVEAVTALMEKLKKEITDNK